MAVFWYGADARALHASQGLRVGLPPAVFKRGATGKTEATLGEVLVVSVLWAEKEAEPAIPSAYLQRRGGTHGLNFSRNSATGRHRLFTTQSLRRWEAKQKILTELSIFILLVAKFLILIHENSELIPVGILAGPIFFEANRYFLPTFLPIHNFDGATSYHGGAGRFCVMASVAGLIGKLSSVTGNLQKHYFYLPWRYDFFVVSVSG